jgi:hypothetical protein
MARRWPICPGLGFAGDLSLWPEKYGVTAGRLQLPFGVGTAEERLADMSQTLCVPVSPGQGPRAVSILATLRRFHRDESVFPG